jgi:hypothetical protein
MQETRRHSLPATKVPQEFGQVDIVSASDGPTPVNFVGLCPRSAHLKTGSAIMTAIRRRNNEFDTNSAGQSGADQQISNLPDADSESVEELVEEGNAFEANVIEGVEDAGDADVSEVTTREVPEDDVPEEYLNDSNKDVA